jgi:hypothetical protein
MLLISCITILREFECIPSCVVSQQVLKMSSTSINAPMDTSDHGLWRHFKGPAAVANGLKGIRHVLINLLAPEFYI